MYNVRTTENVTIISSQPKYQVILLATPYDIIDFFKDYGSHADHANGVYEIKEQDRNVKSSRSIKYRPSREGGFGVLPSRKFCESVCDLVQVWANIMHKSMCITLKHISNDMTINCIGRIGYWMARCLDYPFGAKNI